MHWPSILLYMSSSFMIVIFNKIVLTVFAFTSVPFLMLVQSLFTSGVILLRCTPIQRPKKDIALACMLNAANVFFGLSSAKALNIAMFTALRRISIFMTMMAQHWYLGVPLDRRVMWPVSFMIMGSLMAAANDLTFSLTGYAYVMVNNLLTAAAQIQTKKTLESNWTKSSVLFWTGIASACASAVLLVHWDPSSFDAWNVTSFQFAFACSICLGFAINYGYTWTIQENDALTLAVAGSTKSALMGLMVVMGIFDHTYIFSWWNFVGLQVSTLGSFLYVYYKNVPESETTECLALATDQEKEQEINTENETP